LLAKPFTEKMLAMLKKDKASPLRKAVPPGVAVANKPGALDGVRCDAGIVYLASRPYIFVGMTKYLASDDQGEQALIQAARAVHGYFQRLAKANIFGRALPD
jgi:beta-lactamase class A